MDDGQGDTVDPDHRVALVQRLVDDFEREDGNDEGEADVACDKVEELWDLPRCCEGGLCEGDGAGACESVFLRNGEGEDGGR